MAWFVRNPRIGSISGEPAFLVEIGLGDGPAVCLESLGIGDRLKSATSLGRFACVRRENRRDKKERCLAGSGTPVAVAGLGSGSAVAGELSLKVLLFVLLLSLRLERVTSERTARGPWLSARGSNTTFPAVLVRDTTFRETHRSSEACCSCESSQRMHELQERRDEIMSKMEDDRGVGS